MDGVRRAIFAALVVIGVAFVAFWSVRARAASRRTGEKLAPSLLGLAIGFVTNFFDTLGIGAFAPTTSVFKLCRLVPDEKIPGSLNVGHAVPTVVEGLIFIAVVDVEVRTLVALIAASVLGAWFGAGVVARLPKRAIQAGMGVALVVAASFFAAKNLGVFPGGGDALALEGWRFWTGVAGNLVFGALMTLGIGLYAPCMILVSLLGMSPLAAFPIMMGSCAFLMPAGGVRFIEKERYDAKASIGLAAGGVPGVLVAAWIVRSLDLVVLRWGVVGVVLYTAFAMLRSARRRED
jgi:uncharacterized membrane protein YfcA